MSGDADRPNVLLIHSHDLGRELGCYGRDVTTPNVDRLAEEGVRFDQYFCTAPQCSPSRGSILSGQYPHVNGLVELAHCGGEMDPDVRTLPEYLRDAGYHTVQYGIQHAGDADRLGFESVHDCLTFPMATDEDPWAGPPAWRALDVAEQFESTLDDELLGGEGPFYAHVGFDEPHEPFRRPYLGDDFYDRDPASTALPPFLSEDDIGADSPRATTTTDDLSRERIADLHDLIEGTVDPAVERIYAALAERGVLDDTLVIFTADHGLDVPRGKLTPYVGGVETPLIVRHGDLPSGEVRDELLSNVDLMPTILDFVGVERTRRTDGRSFLPLLDDRRYVPRDRVFSEETWHANHPGTFRAIRTNEFTFVKNYFTERLNEGRAPEMLFDRREDPYERENLVDDPVYETVADTLRSELARWMRETDDPLADGCLPIQGDDRKWATERL